MKIDYFDAAQALAEARPNMRAETLIALAIAVVDGVKPLDLNDAQALGKWAARQPDIARLIAAGKRINAIKELRALTDASLAQAKYALDTIPASSWGATA